MIWQPPLTLTVYPTVGGGIPDQLCTLAAVGRAYHISEAAITKGSSDPIAVEVLDAAFRLVFLWVNPLSHHVEDEDSSLPSTKG